MDTLTLDNVWIACVTVVLAALCYAVTIWCHQQSERIHQQRMEERDSRNAESDRAALARAPDTFAEARARAAVMAAQIPPEIASGEVPDPRAPRFLWWTTREEAEKAETAILPPWLARLFARRQCVRWDGVSVWTPPGFDTVVPPLDNAGDACMITTNELAVVFANSGRVTDLSGNPVLPPVNF